jgi:hypothetical protein
VKQITHFEFGEGFMHRTFTNRKVLLTFFLLVCPILALSQINIKEKISIDPKEKTQASTSSLTFDVTNFVTLPMDGMVYAQPTPLIPYGAPRSLLLNGDTVARNLENGFFVNLGQYPAGTQLSFSLYVRDEHAGPGTGTVYPVKAVKTLYVNGCGAGYEIGDTYDSNGDTVFNTFFIEVYVVPTAITPPLDFELYSDNDQVYFTFQLPLTVAVYDACGNLADVPGLTFQASIASGQEWGILADPTTGRSGSVVSGIPLSGGIALVNFNAWGNEPQQSETVTIVAATDDGQYSMSQDITVRPYPFRLVVTPGRSSIQPGDTTSLDIQMLNPDGTPVSADLVSSTYTLVENDTLAVLYSPDSSQVGTTITGVLPSARLYIPKRSDLPSSFDVKILASAEESCPGCGTSKVVPGNHPKMPIGRANIVKSSADSVAWMFRRHLWEEKLEAGNQKVMLSTRSTGTSGQVPTNPHIETDIRHCGMAKVTVQKNEEDCINVTFATSPISPGDTVLLNFTTTDVNGMPVSVAPDRLMDVLLINHSTVHGYLLASTGKRATMALDSVLQPIWYVAEDSLATDSAVVQIVAAESGTGIFASTTAPHGTTKGKRPIVNKVAALHVPMIEGRLTLALIRALQNDVCLPDAGVVKEGPHHFNVSFASNSIAFTEATSIYVVAKDSRGNEIALGDGVKLNFSLEGPLNIYGKFINVSGDTLKSLTNVKYEDARIGNVQFAAVDHNPATAAIVQVTVKEATDTTKTGMGEITLFEQTLKIAMSTPYEVRPSIPTEDGDTAKERLRKKNFEVRMTRAGKPVTGHPFRLSTNYVNESGGHDHGDTRTRRRVDNDDNYGFFFTNDDDNGQRPWEDMTDTSGRFSINYFASIFGDTMRICLQSKSNRLLRDSISICEKVDSLINFRSISSNGRWIFHQSDTGVMRHHDNNWCTPEFSDSLQLAIEKFYNWTLAKEHGGTAIPVSLNDMSLPYGGRYDISGLWDGRDSQYHKYHRLGTSVDVNPTLDSAQVFRLTRYMAESGLERNGERPQIHYGSNGGN